MQSKRVREIVVPPLKGLPLQPQVNSDDRIIDAIEVMLTCNVRQIMVTRNRCPVGMIILADAFHQLGLEMPPTRRAPRCGAARRRKEKI